MKTSRIIFIVIIVASIAIMVGCSKLTQLKGSISGYVFRSGRPTMGQIAVINPRTLGTLKVEPVNNSGHFMIPDVPPGEYLLSFMGPTAMPLGEYMYVKVAMGRPVTGITFEITEKDPKAIELIEKVKAEKAAGTTGGTAKSGGTAGTGK